MNDFTIDILAHVAFAIDFVEEMLITPYILVARGHHSRHFSWGEWGDLIQQSGTNSQMHHCCFRPDEIIRQGTFTA